MEENVDLESEDDNHPCHKRTVEKYLFLNGYKIIPSTK